MLQMARICGIQFRGTIFLQALIALVHSKDCGQEIYSVVTAKSGDAIVFVSDPYTPEDILTRSTILWLESTGRYTPVAYFRVYDTGKVIIGGTAPEVSVEVHLVEPRDRPGVDIQNVTIIMANVSEADSGVYTLYDYHFRQTLNCWTLYVLGEGKYDTSQEYIEEGTLFKVTNFNHLSEEVVQRLNASTSWQIEDKVITQQSGYTVHITRSMNNKPLRYTIEGHAHNATSVSYILYVSYTGPIVFVPNQTSYTLPLNATLQPITCDAVCYPKCDMNWARRITTVSESNVLRPLIIFDRIAEFICQATNKHTGKKLNESIIIYLAEENGLSTTEQCGESRTLVYVFATLTVVFVLSTVALALLYCRNDFFSLRLPGFLRREKKTDTVAMGAAKVTGDINDRPNATYEDVNSRGCKENMYDGIYNQDQQEENYVNL